MNAGYQSRSFRGTGDRSRSPHVKMLRFRIRNRIRNLPKALGRTETGHGTGPEGRIERLRQLVTAVVRHERIEGFRPHLDESRGYLERLIQEAQKHGDKHRKTMELADYWLLEKDLVHKLFKVLAPRYQNYSTSFTQMHRLPGKVPGGNKPLCILELKGNPWPPVNPHHREIRGTLVNVLVAELRKDVHRERLQHATNPASDNSASNQHPEVPPDGTPV